MSRSVRDLLRDALTERGINQKQFAEEIGVAPATVNRWIKGTQVPGPALVPLVAKTARVDPTELWEAVSAHERGRASAAERQTSKDRADRDLVLNKIGEFIVQYEELGHTYRSISGDMALLLERALPLQDIFTNINRQLEELNERLGRLEKRQR